MKVLFLPKWYPNLNDVQHGIFIKNQAKAIAKYTPVGVLFVVTSAQVDEEKTEIESDGNYFSLTWYFPKKPNRLFALYSYYKAFSRAKEKMDKEWGKPDVINLYILGRNYMMYKKFYSGIPFVVSEQWSGYLNGGIEKYIYAKRRNTLQALKKADGLIAVSPSLAKAVKKYSNQREVAVIPNIVYADRLTENSLSAVIRILTVADLDDRVKNISGMLKALQMVSKTYPIEFKIIGEGVDGEKLQEMSREMAHQDLSITFEKRMPHAILLKHYAWCNFYLLNSAIETFCVSAAEAIMAGRPVVATRCGGPEEYLTDQNAVMVNGSSNTDLAEAITKMIHHLTNNHYRIETITQSIAYRYGADTIAKQYITQFEAAINKKKAES